MHVVQITLKASAWEANCLVLTCAVMNVNCYLTFHVQQLNSMTFQAWKMKFVNSMTFQGFNDLYKPCNVIVNSSSPLHFIFCFR